MKTEMNIEGMHCASCIALLTDVLLENPGVEKATVTMGKATIEHDARAVNTAQLKKIIDDEGYHATERK